MTNKPEFDMKAAHKYFSAACFNGAWELLDKSDRTAEEDEQMLRLSMASHWHWTQREDCADTNISVSYWQASRIYAVLGQVENAKRYAELCLAVSQGDDIPPFYLGYAYEALARAELVAGNKKQMQANLKEAHKAADKVADKEEQKWLLDDLATIK
jgi:tetratricopeptide (TPR) repeat protein